MKYLLSPIISDAISGARPGARRQVDSYIQRLKDLKKLTFTGVKAFKLVENLELFESEKYLMIMQLHYLLKFHKTNRRLIQVRLK
jgi:hypothetical protein